VTSTTSSSTTNSPRRERRWPLRHQRRHGTSRSGKRKAHVLKNHMEPNPAQTQPPWPVAARCAQSIVRGHDAHAGFRRANRARTDVRQPIAFASTSAAALWVAEAVKLSGKTARGKGQGSILIAKTWTATAFSKSAPSYRRTSMYRERLVFGSRFVGYLRVGRPPARKRF